MLVRKPFALIAPVLLALSFGACNNSDDSPTAVTPSPSPVATPTPTPAPSPSPVSARCTLPAMPDCGFSGCCRGGGSPLFDNEIDAAQAELRRTRPDIVAANGVIQVEEVRYVAVLAQKIMDMYPGVCAVGGTGNVTSVSKDEVVLKRDNGTSQNVDVIIGSNYTNWVGGRYTCNPAAF